MRYKPSDTYTMWVRWPLHITAPTRRDMDFIDHVRKDTEEYGVVYSPGGKIRIIFHPTFVWYHDGDSSILIAGMLFPDGTEWWPLHATSND